MIPKQNRLLKDKDFGRVFKKGHSVAEDFLVIRFTPNEKEYSRFGFIVSLKVSKKAVVRNRVKRWLRDIVHRCLPEIKKGLDVVIIISNGSKLKNFQQVEEKFKKAIKKGKLIKDV